MNLKKYLYGIVQKIASNQDSLFNISMKKQKRYLEKINEPLNLIERSYNQYLCQRWLKRRYINIITDIGSALLNGYYYMKREDPILKPRHYKAVFIGMGLGNDIIPGELKEIYGDILNVSQTGERLAKVDKRIIKKLVHKYPLSFEFILKCLIKVRMYRWIIDMYSPIAIIVSEEYSYTSSFLTYYCRKNGIKHINIMHGEKLYYIRDSFAEFDEFYIWDRYYKDLFEQLRMPSNQFIIAVPPALCLQGFYEKKYDYTYYLAGEPKEKLVCILELLKKIKSMGYKVAVRPHPRYSEIKLINKIFKGKIEIEDFHKVQIKESILITRNIISLYSTVINQAICSGVNVVIDDLSDIKKYRLLYELKYRFINDKRVLLASELVRDN